MRIALCLSGFLRSYKATFASLQKYIIAPYNPDIFIHTYNIQGFDGIRGDRAAMTSPTIKDELISLYKPKKLLIEQSKNLLNLNKYLRRIGSGLRDPNIVPSMFYGIYQANSLKTIWEVETGSKYDIVIRSRPDVCYENTIEPEELANCIDNNSIYFPNFGNYGGLNDQFAFGTSDQMDLYSSTFYNIDTFFDLGCLFHAETMIKFTVDYFGIPISRTSTSYFLQRADGSIFRNAIN